jgi:hypothetical protein
MKNLKSKIPLLTLAVMYLNLGLFAQEKAIQYFRSYDQKGINVFEPKKDSTEFNGTWVRVGGNFTQQYQGISHENNADYREGVYRGSTVDLNKLYEMKGGFNLATANLYLDVQLDDGIRLAVENYMSSRHHPEFWVKGGYIQVDKLPMFGSPDWFTDKFRVKIGHFQVNYGDQQFRRTDNGNAMYNPFVGNYIMDAFATEIGAEVYAFINDEVMVMGGMTNGLINGVIDNSTREPSIYGKLTYDKQVNSDLRFRASVSYYTNPNSARNTLYAGDRAGSRFYMAMEPALFVPRGTTTLTPANATDLFTSGRLSPNFTQQVSAFQINPFIKYKGFEFFGTFETSSGYSNTENKTKRSVNQLAGEFIYRFLPKEQAFMAARFNTVSDEFSSAVKEGNIQRMEISGGWFPAKNLLLKLEYVDQKYSGYPSSSHLHEGRFNGFMLEAVVGF